MKFVLYFKSIWIPIASAISFDYAIELQYSFHDGYIVRSNARSRKRLNPTLFPRLSHAKPALNPR